MGSLIPEILDTSGCCSFYSVFFLLSTLQAGPTSNDSFSYKCLAPRLATNFTNLKIVHFLPSAKEYESVSPSNRPTYLRARICLGTVRHQQIKQRNHIQVVAQNLYSCDTSQTPMQFGMLASRLM
ncbi:Uncharacterized protein APZ42_030762 [Daphnia magna]|uniref:Uncharacterized protein n=1 Tax=Daphnia magna TaxID=35525 RepID=A0A164NBC7_9CRUS|nr:Uncharacterized protein APZ42_030762 [Daphnia magna]